MLTGDFVCSCDVIDQQHWIECNLCQRNTAEGADIYLGREDSCYVIGNEINDHYEDDSPLLTNADGARLNEIYDGPRSVIQNLCSPHPYVAIFYFCLFQVWCAFVLLNLVIAVIIDNFTIASEDEELTVGKDQLQQYIDAWMKFDAYATQFIR